METGRPMDIRFDENSIQSNSRMITGGGHSKSKSE